MISEEQVKHIAKLAKLELSPKDVKKFSHQLSDILGYVEQLSEVDTEGVEPTSQVTGLTNVTESDKEVNCPHSKELLDCSKLPKVRGQIRVHSSFT
jgi:aspartyl-tRNA(Asn)/glutamyl-tRNA(Gln) amidotransferase subunit C